MQLLRRFARWPAPLSGSFPEHRGLNLTWEVREGIIKHETSYDKSDAAAFDSDKQPTLELMRTLNSVCKSPLAAERLEKNFERLWPSIYDGILEGLTQHAADAAR